ncbi:DNA cytosine methyltransferase [Rhodococcus zopfii]|uniref:DNA cytosine methyltransferase n=1 Tax=Rhodococcus zopfii TaxID=43772 RepID=UPI0011112F18|nr:DNA cytosine methyltransferase [Rhodococcus zopfii]
MSSESALTFDVDDPCIVDLFAGPGGLDVAAHWLGVPVVGVEWDANACATRVQAGLQTKRRDVRDLGPWNFPSANVLAGGPPCQTFTVAGSGTGRRALDVVLALVEMLENRQYAEVKDFLSRMEDERTGLVLEPLRWALRALDDEQPYEAIVLEQVPAVRPVWDAFKRVLESRGYGVDVDVIHTEQFGVPQTRRRAILIARLGADVSLPKATHREYRKGVARTDGDKSKLPWVTMKEALGRGNFEVISNYGTGGIPSARGRRTADQPAFTVTGKISRNRVVEANGTVCRFAMAEAGQLQTFPADYPWSEKDTAQQIGNAIPPRLAAHVLAAVLGANRLEEGFLNQAVKGSWKAQQSGARVSVSV